MITTNKNKMNKKQKFMWIIVFTMLVINILVFAQQNYRMIALGNGIVLIGLVYDWIMNYIGEI